MKYLFWLLVIINIGLFTYFNLDRILPSQQQVKPAEISPEKIQVLSQNQIEALPKKEATSPPETPTPQQVTTPPAATTACFEWGVFSNANLANAQHAVTKLALRATVKAQNSQQAKRFWVYRPPLRSAAEAQQKAAEFKALGVQDLFVVQEAKWKNAISFGIFEDEQLANKLQQELLAKGVKNVEKTLHNQGAGHSSLLLGNLAENDAAELRKLKPNFPEADLKQVSCN